jgi:hypothetical protein
VAYFPGDRTDYLLWQFCLQVWVWLSHALKQGVLKVVGQTRLHDAFSVAQRAKHASAAASANLNRLLTTMLGSANTGPANINRNPKPYTSFIRVPQTEHRSVHVIATNSAGGLRTSPPYGVLLRLGTNREFFNRMTGLKSCRQPARLFTAP